MNLIFNESEKEFVCRQCGMFLDSKDLIDGKCPCCNSDENIFINDLNEQE